MVETVLVTYSTRYGSTAEVVEAVARSLREAGLETVVQPVKEVTSLQGFDAVLLGAPMYIGHWPKDARRFLATHREALARMPVAVLSLGPLSPSDLAEGAQEQWDAELAGYSWLKPIKAGLFGGKFDPTRLGFVDKVLTKLPPSPLRDRPAIDARDWEAIDAWAKELAAALKAAPTG